MPNYAGGENTSELHAYGTEECDQNRKNFKCLHIGWIWFLLLHSGAEQQIVDDFLRRHADNAATTNVLVQASGKLVLIDKLLPKLKANGHKVCTCMYVLLVTFVHVCL